MDTYKLRFTALQMGILRLLSAYAENPQSQREIAKILNVSPTAVGKSIKKLKNDNLIIIIREKEMNLTHISLNRNNKKAIELKRIQNLSFLYECEITEFLEDEFKGCAIILFGSYSRGEDTVKSDIDIAIIGAKEKDLELGKYEKILNRKISLQFYDDFVSIHKNLKESIFNGIILSGSVSL